MPDSPAVGTVHKGDRPLTTIDQWHRFAPPKRDIHWKDGRSAKENARAWLDAAPGLQPDIAQILVAEDDHGPVVIAIEAKADETFGNELANQYQRARAARASNPPSKAVARIEALLDRFALDIEQRHVPQLRYQLLTATAAVLAEANRRSSERAVLIVHEFVTPLTLPERRERNAADLDRFLATALDREGHLAPGDVAGPILVQGRFPTLYVGKARTVV